VYAGKHNVATKFLRMRLCPHNYLLYFFCASVSHTAYLNILQRVFPQLRERGFEATAILLQDGARGHCAVQI
jgi:hypothetical protein